MNDLTIKESLTLILQAWPLYLPCLCPCYICSCPLIFNTHKSMKYTLYIVTEKSVIVSTAGIKSKNFTMNHYPFSKLFQRIRSCTEYPHGFSSYKPVFSLILVYCFHYYAHCQYKNSKNELEMIELIKSEAPNEIMMIIVIKNEAQSSIREHNRGITQQKHTK